MSDMYTILIKEDHSLVHTHKKRIMYRTTGIDSLRFLVAQKYGNLDMTKVNAVLEYRTPASKTYGTLVMTPESELYSGFVQFIVPVDLRFTREVGNLELTINFSYLTMDNEGNFLEQVRKVGQTEIEIYDTNRWPDYIASADLDSIAQISLHTQAQLEEMKVLAEMIAYNKADGIAKDEFTNEIYLTSQGVEIGSRIKDSDTCSSDEGVPVVEFTTVEPDDGNTEVNNVVQF